MSIQVADNFQYLGRKPLDSRLVCDTLSAMASLAESIIYEGILVYNKETKKFYSFDPANSVDATTGKWREFESGGGTGNALIAAYAQNTAYTKDTLIYCGDRIGRASADFTSDATKSLLTESFAKDIESGSIIVDKIDITEIDDQLLKALPIVAFVTKHDIPRFQSQMTVDGTIPTFRDGSSLSLAEKKGCNFLYIIDANGELTGLAIITNYDEANDIFTVNAMKYGVGTADNILPAHNVLTKRTVGETQIIYKDNLLDPLFIIQSTAPIDNTKLWYESTELDANDITVGSVQVKKYNTTTSAWDTTETIDVKEGDVVKNGNGAEWEYFRIQSTGNVFISLARWQLVYDTNQILGKIIDIDTTTHEVTIKTIHANAESDAVLEEEVQTNTAIGAATAGTKFPKDMTFTEFVKKISIKDILVTLNFTASGSGLVRKTHAVDGSILTATITNIGNVPIEKVTFYKGNTVIEEKPFVDGVFTYISEISDLIATDTTAAVVVTQEGNKTVRKEAKFIFVNQTYVGVVDTLTPSVTDILNLTEYLKESYKGSYTTTLNDQRVCIAYPASMGNITSIKDKNNFEYINSFTKTTETINNDTYNVYVLTDAVTATNFVWTFN